MTGRTNVGGSITYAVIDVTYPEGAVCTCTKGARILKAKDTAGHWLFLIPESGEWTVTATHGDKVKTETVEIDTSKAYSVVLSFAMYIIKDGVVAEAFAIKKYHQAKWSTVSGDDAYIEYYNSDGAYAAVAFEPTIDLTGYSSLILSAANYSSLSSGYLGVLKKNNLSDPGKYDQWYMARVQVKDGTSTNETLLDVSEFDGEQTLGIYSAAGPGTIVSLHIYELRLE